MTEKVVTTPARKVGLEEFLNNMPEVRNGRVEFVGAFAHYMEYIKKITRDTEKNFRQFLDEFRTKPI